MKKVLVITYYWPPAGGPGVQRWLKFVTYFRDFGIEPVLYVPENPDYPIRDTSLSGEVPSGIRIYSKKIREPLQWLGGRIKKEAKRISSGIVGAGPSPTEKALLWIRGNFFIPDARILWVKPSVRYLKEVLAKEGIDTVITTGPPHSTHLIGLALQKQEGIRWLADFRDPWTTIGYHDKLKLGRFARKKHKRLEKLVLRNAGKIVVTSETTQQEFQRITTRPVHVITNGYDPVAYQNEPAEPDAGFTISHIGSLLSGRDPDSLWKAIGELAQENIEFRDALKLRLVGIVSPEVLENMRRYKLQGYLECLDYIPHGDVVNFQQRSQILLLVEINRPETEGILPGKLFEYLAAGRPILAVGPDKWEAGAIIRKLKAGAVFKYDETAAIKETLLGWFKLRSEGKLVSQSIGVAKYSRRELTRQMARELLWE